MKRLLACAAAAVVLAACVPGAERPNVAGNEQPMPDIVGLTEEEATQRLERYGVNVQVQRRDSTTHQSGDAIDVLPRPGEKISAGDIVTVIVAEPPN